MDRKLTQLLLVSGCNVSFIARAWCASQVRSPALCTNQDRGNLDWKNPSNARLSDGAHASVSSGGAFTTDFLRCEDYGFTNPASAIITRIQVRVKRSFSRSGPPFFTVRDETVQLLVGGIGSGDNKVDTFTSWPSTDTVAS